MKTPVFGITGWKNSGKTTLLTGLVSEFTKRGFRVSTVKHAHHAFDIDQPGRDSFRHREAGASEVAIVSSNRWVLMHELLEEDEPDLPEVLSRMSPCDLLLIEGYKREQHAKIEVRRTAAGKDTNFLEKDPSIVAIASNFEIRDADRPVYGLDDLTGIADFIQRHLKLEKNMTDKIKLLNDCFYHDKNRLKHEEAIMILQQRITTVCEKELIQLRELNGRILAQDVAAQHDIPLLSNSAVDGYGFRHKDLEDTGGIFSVASTIAAGDTQTHEFEFGTAVRIFTGAVTPDGIDTIAMQEDCKVEKQDGTTRVFIPEDIRKSSNLRSAGEDMTEGEIICRKGQRLRPQELAALASAGIDKVFVHRKLRVAVLSTGNEIIRPGSDLQSGQVFDSNTYLIGSMLQYLPVEYSDLGILPDSKETIVQELSQVSREYDVILTTGGASLGEEDYLNSAINKLGSRHMWQLAIKPGRPMSFGQIGDCAILALPGNPVAVMVCFLLYVFPAILKLAGANWSSPNRYELPAAFEIRTKKTGRREFYRGKLLRSQRGGLLVDKFERDGSGLITGLREADGLIEIDEQTTTVAEGDTVPFIPFTEFGLPAKL